MQGGAAMTTQPMDEVLFVVQRWYALLRRYLFAPETPCKQTARRWMELAQKRYGINLPIV